MFDRCPARQRAARVTTGRYLTRRERKCIGKRQHDEASARQEAARLLSLGELRIRPYACECGHWHVGRTKRTT